MTGAKEFHSGKSDEIYVKLFGSEGTTAEHLCQANRSFNVIDSCTFPIFTEIGNLTTIMIRNAGDDYWSFKSIQVEIDGVTEGVKIGNRPVTKFDEVFVRFNKEPDVDDEGEQVTSK